jgi:hypothetical protein
MKPSEYDRVWTIRGTVQVHDDIYLLPGDRLRFIPNKGGVHRVVVIEGKDSEIWETCMDLVVAPGEDPVITDLPIADSESMKDRGTYHDAIIRFLDRVPSCRRLVGTLTDSKGDANVAVVVAKAPEPANPSKVRKILIIHVQHKVVHAQNGTGHGD